MAKGILFGGLMLAGLSLLHGAPLHADVKAGVEAWTRGDFAGAVAAWQGLAAQGDADAQFNLGQAYKLGRGVKQDMAKAEQLFFKAANQGHLQASDNYGLMLFQRGERARALPYVSAAADRGDPRAQYLLGIANFNGDSVPKDWVRAYALVSLAQQAGLAQASPALAQMDRYIPIEDRQKSVALAQELAAQAEATRARQLASADLGNTVSGVAAPQAAAAPLPPVAVAAPPQQAAAGAGVPGAGVTGGGDPGRGDPDSAGADYVRPRPPVAAATPPRPAPPKLTPPRPTPPPRPAPAAAIAAARPSAAAPAPRPAPRTVAAGGASWRIQLGAFGVAGNAEALWARIRGRPELAGHARLLVPAGAVTKLQAGGFSSQAAAQGVCARLQTASIGCIAVPG